MTIPTDDDFARANSLMAERDANWDQMQTLAMLNLAKVAKLHHFALFPRELCSFAAVIFFDTDQDLAVAKINGFAKVAENCIRSAVAKFRAGQCADIAIAIELDSYDNVRRNFGGNYVNRLR